jgi:hypothetical protein
MSTLIDGADGVNDPLRGELETGSRFGVTNLASAERDARGEKFIARRVVNGSVHSAARQQRRVCCIDDGINLL